MNKPIALLAAIALGLPFAVSAQVNPAFSEITEAAEQARTIVQTERKLVLSQALALDPAESNAFWPVYDKYAAELKSAGDLRLKVITDYAASYTSMNDETARRLIKDSLDYQEKVLKIRKHYLGKFRKTLPETKLARFYQVENKLDAITNFALARGIPLMPGSAASKPAVRPGG